MLEADSAVRLVEDPGGRLEADPAGRVVEDPG